MKKKQAAEKPDRHKKKGKTKPGLTFVERRRLAELKHMLAGTNKNAEKPTTAQKTITFQKMYRDGICQVTSGFYTKMVEFYDINYDLLAIEDKGEILEQYSRLINYFDSSIKFELFLFNRQVNEQKPLDTHLNQRGQQIVGQRFTLDTALVNGRGHMRVGDSSWPVVADDDLSAGTRVEVVAVEGITLRVKAC